MQELAAAEVNEETIEIGDLDDSIGFLTRIAQLQVFEQFFDQLGHLGLRPGEFSTLLVIGRNPNIRQGLLAQTLHIKPAQMSKLIRVFEDDGLVERIIPDHNRRSVELVLTDKGRAFIEKHRPAFRKHETTRPNGLTESETAQFRKLLRKFVGMAREDEQ